MANFIFPISLGLNKQSLGGCVSTYLFDFLITHGSKFLNKFQNQRIISFDFLAYTKYQTNVVVM